MTATTCCTYFLSFHLGDAD